MKKVIFFSLLLLIPFLVFNFGCAKRQLMPGEEIQIAGKNKPEWTYDPISRDTKNLRAFVGVSHDFQMEGDARADALKDARQQIIDYMGITGKRIIREAIATSGVSSDIINPAMDKKEESEFLSESHIKTRAKNYHIERWQRVKADYSVENYYKIYVLVLFDESDTQKYFQEVLAEAKKKADNDDKQRLIQKAEQLLNDKSLFER